VSNPYLTLPVPGHRAVGDRMRARTTFDPAQPHIPLVLTGPITAIRERTEPARLRPAYDWWEYAQAHEMAVNAYFDLHGRELVLPESVVRELRAKAGGPAVEARALFRLLGDEPS